MIIRMENEGLSLPQMEALLETSQEVRFAAKGRKEIYEWVERVLVRQEYAMQGKRTRGVVRAYLAKMTGKSLPQVPDLVGECGETGRVGAGGVVRAYLAKMTGKSLPQIPRLVRQYRETGQVRARIYRRRKFVRVYTEADRSEERRGGKEGRSWWSTERRMRRPS